MSGVEGQNVPASILNSIAMQIAVLDATGRIVAVNDAWSEFARGNGGSEGLAAGIGLDYLEICRNATGPFSEEAGSAYDGLAAVLQGRSASFTLEYPCHAPGKQRWFLLTATPLKASRKGAVVYHLDVTARVEAETERARLEARSRAFLESAPDALVVVARTGEIALANARAVEMFGYSPEELIGRPVEDLIPERFRDEHPEHRLSYFEDTRTRPMGVGRELYGRRRDGHEFAVEITLSPVGSNHEQQVVAAVRDISERKRLELQSRALREELAHVSRLSTMAEFATGLAHELNQPLTGITQYCDAALSTAAEAAADPELKDLLVSIQEQAYRAGEIIRALRRFVRKDLSVMVADDLNEIVRQTVRLIEAEARDNGVELVLALDEDLPAVEMDRVQLAQVLLNLLRNSLDALENVDEDSRRILVRTELADADVRVSVEDTGPGIAPGVDVFEPFETGKREGMGVGLSISRSIIEAHRGTLTVDASGGAGACFSFRLPTEAR